MGMTLEECIEKIAELTEDRSRLVKNRHKHADVIIAWANGEEIEFRNMDMEDWLPMNRANPMWHEYVEYRVKPKIVKKYADVAVYKLADGSYKVQLLFFGDMHLTIEGSSMVTRQRIEWEEEETWDAKEEMAEDVGSEVERFPEVLKAFSEGKTIQCWDGSSWLDWTHSSDPPHVSGFSPWRIKTKEPKRLTNENFIALFMEYACANLSNQKEYQDGWYTSEMEIALDVAGSFYAWLEKQHE